MFNYWSRQKKEFKSWSIKSFKFLCLLIVRIYRAFLSGHIGGCCRYYPTCSAYALEALEKKPFPKSVLILLRRLLRCHPFTKKIGYDPLIQGVEEEVFLDSKNVKTMKAIQNSRTSRDWQKQGWFLRFFRLFKWIRWKSNLAVQQTVIQNQGTHGTK